MQSNSSDNRSFFLMETTAAATDPLEGKASFKASHGSAVSGPLELIRRRLLSVLTISAVLLIPCFWQRSLEAGDLRSHVYNAWLVQLIEQGQAPGLWIARQWSNVLFDLVVSGFGRFVSLSLAGRFAAALSVLIFFWGAFSFIRAATRRPPWSLVPIIAIVAYGWTFQEGLLNYYLSIGLAFWGLSAFRHRRGAGIIAMLVLAPLIWMAQPLGLFWMVAAAAYLAAADSVPLRFHFFLMLAAVFVLLLAQIHLRRHFAVQASDHSVFFYSGLDQLIFSRRYVLPALMLCVAFLLALVAEVAQDGKYGEFFAKCAVPLELYLIVEAGAQMLPETVYLPQYSAPISVLTARLTSVSAVLLCCLIGSVRPRRWHGYVFATVAGVFFTFLYQDTLVLNRIQEQAEHLVHTLPPGQRIIETFKPPLKYRFSVKHMSEVSCIGQCFSYGNYEPASGQFRVRAAPGNLIVVSKVPDGASMERGDYVVRARDLPVYHLYQCGVEWTTLCIRPLEAGETIDHFAGR